MALLSSRPRDDKDDMLIMLVATWLTKRGFQDIGSYPQAHQLLVALDHYSQLGNIESLVEELKLQEAYQLLMDI